MKIVHEEIAPVASVVRSQFLVFSLEISLGQHDQASALHLSVPLLAGAVRARRRRGSSALSSE